MPTALHAASWHLIDSSFPQSGDGLAVPVRRLAAGAASLRIANLDRADPPDYTAGGVPRSAAFNRNVLSLTAAASLPPIPVVCDVAGFDPASTPIRWRLVCRHVLGRYHNEGGYRYRGMCTPLDREWRGESTKASFTLFGGGPAECACTYNDDSRVMGGHALLLVGAALPAGTLLDYVHLRLGGANPAAADVQAWLDRQLQGCDNNIVCMARAVFAHESSYRQFAPAAQTGASMNFTQRQHTNPAQPDCRVRFDWPDDPPGFPLASYDFGIGISQWTHPEELTPDIAWDWRENLRIGAALFLDRLRRNFRSGVTWMDWAMASWAAYNGTGSGAAAYAAKLAGSPDGVLVSRAAVAGAPEIARLDPPAPLADPGVWLA